MIVKNVDYSQFNFKGYHFDKDLLTNGEFVYFVSDDNEDNFFEFRTFKNEADEVLLLNYTGCSTDGAFVLKATSKEDIEKQVKAYLGI